jgi:hypothetical protein
VGGSEAKSIIQKTYLTTMNLKAGVNLLLPLFALPTLRLISGSFILLTHESSSCGRSGVKNREMPFFFCVLVDQVNS